jgi:hypothetical protein
VAIGFFENDRFYVILDRGICFYSNHGDKSNVVSLPNETFRYYVSGNRLLTITASGDLSHYESEGKKSFSLPVSDTVVHAKMTNETIYILTESEILCYDDGGNLFSRLNIESGALDFFILDDKSILLCYTSETKRISLTE